MRIGSGLSLAAFLRFVCNGLVTIAETAAFGIAFSLGFVYCELYNYLYQTVRYWRERPLRHRVWLGEPDDLTDALAFCEKRKRPYRWKGVQGRFLFSFRHERDAATFKLYWG